MSLGKPDPICWECGASNARGSSECWLCQRRDWNRYTGRRTRDTRPPDLPRHGPLSTIGGWMIGIAILGVTIALFREAPGLAIALLISVVPALAMTELKAYRRRRGDPLTVGERVAWILVLSVLIPILVAVALAMALFTFFFFLALP